ncbi:hypothetical protein EF847_14100 [Actinobacteria bacterium YIM 96077]|uniref:Twitching motility protein PilT n=1 Tax=Phytoactinopolyspora halophila TaxID=1981511 RepID=A0A329QFX7_9ACTN|nr:Mut7-C RNAse domain-containing protein [Phytoactinopolyspora halophila]AYY13656.1 hypothetical protein EF847_14100 [Actinobacteria bacterium YIM 96077]RAW11220.1 hypothetical protein DPM12_17010 [Phytoactinopolyspora halophila]
MDVTSVDIRFYGDLAEIAARRGGAGLVSVPVGEPRSVKDAIESCGVPHTEVDLLVVDSTSVGFDYLLSPGQRVAVYPRFHAIDVASATRVRPEPPAQPRFVLDVHLGRLAGLLRLAGFDATYSTDASDHALAATSAAERRWLLTRDRRLLMRRRVVHGYLVRSMHPPDQAVEVARRFDLADRLAPFTRCARCNGVLEHVDKDDVLHRLPPATRVERDTIVRCAGCHQLYWRGSHASALEKLVSMMRG